MGSYAEVRIGDRPWGTSKSYVPDDIRSLFRQEDKALEKGAARDLEEESVLVYRADRPTVLARLHTMGYTKQFVAQVLEEKSAAGVAQWESVWEVIKGHLEESEARQVNGERNWRKAIETWWGKGEESMTPREKHEWELLDKLPVLVSLRAVLDRCPDADSVTLDVSDLLDGGYIDRDWVVHGDTEEGIAARTVVVLEGPTDREVIRESLDKLVPQISHLFQVLDASEWIEDGGCRHVRRCIGILAGIRGIVPVVALLDNDAEGRNVVKEMEGKCPRNVVVGTLPDTELGESWPTIGPGGEQEENVNGRAMSIEMYMGEENLKRKGKKKRIRWSSYVNRIGEYQGAIDGKEETQQKFNKAINGKEPLSSSMFADMRKVLEHLIEMSANARIGLMEPEIRRWVNEER